VEGFAVFHRAREKENFLVEVEETSSLRLDLVHFLGDLFRRDIRSLGFPWTVPGPFHVLFLPWEAGRGG